VIGAAMADLVGRGGYGSSVGRTCRCRPQESTDAAHEGNGSAAGVGAPV
jgi:hypothetical protein